MLRPTTECSEWRVLGQLDPECFPKVHISRFGVIPKGNSGKWRLIVDLSSPQWSQREHLLAVLRQYLGCSGMGGWKRRRGSYGKGG